MSERDFPSMDEQPAPPYGWIQWKASEVCCDLVCDCGARMHYEGHFMYHVKCPECGQVYECDGHIRLHKLHHEPDFTKHFRNELEGWIGDDRP